MDKIQLMYIYARNSLLKELYLITNFLIVKVYHCLLNFKFLFGIEIRYKKINNGASFLLLLLTKKA